jgi:hypothetical protein
MAGHLRGQYTALQQHQRLHILLEVVLNEGRRHARTGHQQAVVQTIAQSQRFHVERERLLPVARMKIQLGKVRHQLDEFVVEAVRGGHFPRLLKEGNGLLYIAVLQRNCIFRQLPDELALFLDGLDCLCDFHEYTSSCLLEEINNAV